MLWYGDPDMVKAIHEQMAHTRHQATQRRRLLRLVMGHEEG